MEIEKGSKGSPVGPLCRRLGLNHKSQITNLKQITITETPNSKRDYLSISPFESLDIRILILFACPVGSMRPYQDYLIIGIWRFPALL